MSDIENKLKQILALSKTVADPELLEQITSLLEKSRKKYDEDEDPYTDYADDSDEDFSEDAGFRTFDPDEEGQDDADKWLEENDPDRKKDRDDEESEEESPEDNYYDEYGDDEDEEAHQAEDEELEEQPKKVASTTQGGTPTSASAPAPAPRSEAPQAAEKEVTPKGERFRQPAREELASMREYTRPWEHRARDSTRLSAEAHKNPVLYHEGQILEARNKAHRDRQQAYEAMQGSDEYKNADPITQMEMDAKFHQDWHTNNPDYLTNAVREHEKAHSRVIAKDPDQRVVHRAKELHDAHQNQQREHILRGGAAPDTGMSMEEAMQHAGGTKDEDMGTTGSMMQDRAASFAAGNKEFLSQYAKDYAKKQKKPTSIEDMGELDEGGQKDISRILGDHPNLKDPAKKAKVDKFFQHYYPLIGMSASKVINKLGLDPKKGDLDLGMLHEAGMHGLFQAINDYDHDNHGKASFATHAGNKIRGLMQTALRNQDSIPQDMRRKLREYQQQGTPAVQPPASPPAASPAPVQPATSKIASHPQASDIMDRLKRTDTHRVAQGITPKKPEGGQQ